MRMCVCVLCVWLAVLVNHNLLGGVVPVTGVSESVRSFLEVGEGGLDDGGVDTSLLPKHTIVIRINTIF